MSIRPVAVLPSLQDGMSFADIRLPRKATDDSRIDPGRGFPIIPTPRDWSQGAPGDPRRQRPGHTCCSRACHQAASTDSPPPPEGGRASEEHLKRWPTRIHSGKNRRRVPRQWRPAAGRSDGRHARPFRSGVSAQRLSGYRRDLAEVNALSRGLKTLMRVVPAELAREIEQRTTDRMAAVCIPEQLPSPFRIPGVAHLAPRAGRRAEACLRRRSGPACASGTIACRRGGGGRPLRGR